MSDLKEVYETNENFKAYVNHYARFFSEGKSITVEEALTHKIVGEVAAQYLEGSEKDGK